MEKRKFIDEVAMEFTRRIPHSSVEVKDVIKNNDSVYTGWVIRTEGNATAPTIYVDSVYEEYKRNGMNFDAIMDDLMEFYEKNKADFDVSFFMDYESVKGKLSAKLVNLAANKKHLEENELVYRVVLGDLALIPIVRVNVKGNDGTISITKKHIDIWGITKEQLFEDVDKCLNNEEYDIRDMSHLVGFQQGIIPMYTLSNTQLMHGAHEMLNTKAMDELCEKIGTDEVMILPSSIHEIVAVANVIEDDFGRFVVDMIKEVNVTCLTHEEVLSDHPYVYSRITKEIKGVIE